MRALSDLTNNTIIQRNAVLTLVELERLNRKNDSKWIKKDKKKQQNTIMNLEKCLKLSDMEIISCFYEAFFPKNSSKFQAQITLFLYDSIQYFIARNNALIENLFTSDKKENLFIHELANFQMNEGQSKLIDMELKLSAFKNLIVKHTGNYKPFDKIHEICIINIFVSACNKKHLNLVHEILKVDTPASTWLINTYTGIGNKLMMRKLPDFLMESFKQSPIELQKCIASSTLFLKHFNPKLMENWLSQQINGSRLPFEVHKFYLNKFNSKLSVEWAKKEVENSKYPLNFRISYLQAFGNSLSQKLNSHSFLLFCDAAEKKQLLNKDCINNLKFQFFKVIIPHEADLTKNFSKQAT